MFIHSRPFIRQPIADDTVVQSSTDEQTVASAAATSTDETTTFAPLELNTQLQEGKITFTEFTEKLNELNISYQVYPCASNKNKANIRYEYEGFPYVFNVDISVIKNISTPTTNEPVIPIFKEEDVKNSGLNATAILRYLIKVDNKYKFNAETIEQDFPDKEITTLEELKAAIDEAARKGKNYKYTDLELGNYTIFFTEEKVKNSGLDEEAIAKYLVKIEIGYEFNTVAIEQDFPGKRIETLEELKAAIDETKNAASKATTVTTTTKKSDDTVSKEEESKISEAAKKLRTPITLATSTMAMSCSYAIGDKRSLSIRYVLDKDGNIQFKSNDAQKVFDKILEKLKSNINLQSPEALEAIGGEEMLKKLVQSAWIDASNGTSNKSNVDLNDFVGKIMTNLDKILEMATTRPEVLSYYTSDCYKDSDLVSDLPNLTEKVSTKRAKKYDTGEVHLDDDKSDKKFQETMNALLEKIYAKYPNLARSALESLFYQAQYNALVSANDTLYTTTNSMSGVVDLVLYHFDKLFKTKMKSEISFDSLHLETKATIVREVKSSQTEEQNSDISTGAAGIMYSIEYIVANDIGILCKYTVNKEKIHTEFGVDKDGNIEFEANDTATVYNLIFSEIKSKISVFSPDALERLGGETVLKQLLQAAWITTYNDFNSSQENNTVDFVNKVMDNLKKILEKLQTNPEYLEVFTKRVSYADTTVTTDVKHYNTKTTAGGDEKVSYRGTPTVHADGTVHLSNTTDDNDYQTTMTGVLRNLLDKYPSLDANVITNVFRKAQEQAIYALQSKIFDCPFGTGNNNSRVEDTTKNWSGSNNRSGDSECIHMDQLVQITLYYFDKLLYAELLK